MISIKKYLDMSADDSKRQLSMPPGLLAAALKAYRSTVLAMAQYAATACPASGRELQAYLIKVGNTFTPGLNPHSLEESGIDIEKQLHIWSNQTVQHLNKTANEVREILLVLAKTGEDVCERDQRYAGKFIEITQQLNSISHLDDISLVRSMVLKSAAALKNSTAKMAADGKESMTQLRAQVSSYEARLEEAERLASRDCLTGIRNRLNIEGQIERRIRERKIFCLIMIDLNGFKQINDTYGHAAGDDLLKQFAHEVGAFSHSDDLVGRWGGDEFLIIADSPLSDSEFRAQRLKQWVCGEYDLDLQASKVKVELSASIGVVESTLEDSCASVVQRADEAMYREKKSARPTTSESQSA